MKSDEPSREFLKKGALARLSWTKVSRRSIAAPGAAGQGDVVYGIRTSDDIVRGRNSRETVFKR